MVAGGGILGVIALVLNFLLGGGGGSGGGNGQMAPLPGQQATQQRSAEEDQLAHFVKVVLADTEDVWGQLLRKAGEQYPAPTLVLFTGQVQSGCGYASAQTGPFYCPADQKLYVDLAFYDELRSRFGGGGDFAMAYVVAHEVGHHIQTLMGTSEKMARMRQQLSEAEYNRYSVKMELQADYYAGVFAHYEQGKGYLEAGDMEEALRAANAIGDDNLQKQAQGYAVPESFTHGTSAQRMYWFKKGYETGDISQGDTFNSPDL
jgi:predicted metalloprotease